MGRRTRNNPVQAIAMREREPPSHHRTLKAARRPSPHSLHHRITALPPPEALFVDIPALAHLFSNILFESDLIFAAAAHLYLFAPALVIFAGLLHFRIP